MILWIVMAAMAIVAAAFLLRPLMAGRLVSVPSMVSLAAVVFAFGLYVQIGRPDLTTTQESADIQGMVASLAARLESEPNDIEGWKMLGRSFITLGQYPEAAEAFRRAVVLEGAQNAQTLVDLGESMLAASGQSMSPDIVNIFENALALEADNPSALFWGGIAAANRGDIDVAAERWEALLLTNPPPQIRQIIEQRITEWRGTPAEAPVAVVNVALTLGNAVPGDLPANTPVFIIARDPNAPSPPIAVVRRELAELPGTVAITDADAMIPGRVASGFATLEIVARVSVTGQPIQNSGDWFGTVTAAPGDTVDVEISQQVP
ncbi:MAG: tetratricopeptide repeat protein [Pseudomonadota bacterium]